MPLPLHCATKNPYLRLTASKPEENGRSIAHLQSNISHVSAIAFSSELEVPGASVPYEATNYGGCGTVHKPEAHAISDNITEIMVKSLFLELKESDVTALSACCLPINFQICRL